MLAPHNGGTRLCRHWGANSVGDRPSLRVKCWRPATEIQGFAGNGAPTWPVPGSAPGQNVGASQRRHKALPAMGRQLGRCPADSQGKMLAPRNGGIRLCRQWGANSAGGRAALQGKMLAPRNGGTRLCRQWGANLGGARAAFSCFFGPGLVHESPQTLVLSFPLHQVSGPFQRSAGMDLVHKSPQNLVLSSPLHQISGPFRRSAGADLVHKSPQNLL